MHLSKINLPINEFLKYFDNNGNFLSNNTYISYLQYSISAVFIYIGHAFIGIFLSSKSVS